VGKKWDRLIPEMLDHGSFSITTDVEDISKKSHHSCKCHYSTHGGMINVHNVERMQQSRGVLALRSVLKFSNV
jgi:hypothetical protein